jgi:hypothetical protein
VKSVAIRTLHKRNPEIKKGIKKEKYTSGQWLTEGVLEGSPPSPEIPKF